MPHRFAPLTFTIPSNTTMTMNSASWQIVSSSGTESGMPSPRIAEPETNMVTFGVEMELLVPDSQNDNFPRGGYHEGESSRLWPRGWEGRWDRSIETEEGYYTLEVVSPILQGMDGIRQVKKVAQVMRSAGAKVNPSCGLHVHVGAAAMEVAHVEVIKQTFMHFEPAFFGACGVNAVERLTGHGWDYCKTHKAWGGDWDRRQSLNTSNWSNNDYRKPTIEVRCFSGSIEENTVLGAILMTTSLVNRCMLMTTEGDSPLGLFSETIESPDVAMDVFLDLHFVQPYLVMEEDGVGVIAASLREQAQIATNAMYEAIRVR